MLACFIHVPSPSYPWTTTSSSSSSSRSPQNRKKAKESLTLSWPSYYSSSLTRKGASSASRCDSTSNSSSCRSEIRTSPSISINTRGKKSRNAFLVSYLESPSRVVEYRRKYQRRNYHLFFLLYVTLLTLGWTGNFSSCHFRHLFLALFLLQMLLLSVFLSIYLFLYVGLCCRFSEWRHK